MRKRALAESAMTNNSELEKIRRENMALREQNAKIQDQLQKPEQMAYKES